MFKVLVLFAGVLFLLALINSLIGNNRDKWFPCEWKKFREIGKDRFKSPKEVRDSFGLLVKAEGLLVVIVSVVLVVLYVVLVRYLF